MFKKAKLSNSVNRINEEALYELVAEELTNDEIRIGLWTKAEANSDGNQAKVKSLYIQYRVQSLIDEGRVVEAVADKAVKAIEKSTVTKKEKIVNPTKEYSKHKNSFTTPNKDNPFVKSTQENKTATTEYDGFDPTGCLGYLCLISVLIIIIVGVSITR